MSLPAAVGRLWWHVNRTPARYCVKSALAYAHRHEKRERRQLAARFRDDKRILEKAAKFNRDGYIGLGDVVDASLLDVLANEARDKAARIAELEGVQRQVKKDFWVSLLDKETVDGFRTDSVYVQFALSQPVIALLSAILGELPLLSYVLLTLSRGTASPLSYSQLWHRDYDDIRVIKLFTYLSDVLDDGDGPFTFLPRGESNKIGFTLHSHVPDSLIFNRSDKNSVNVMKAPALTTFMVETSRCYHMGSRMEVGRRRLMYTATFITAPTVFPRNAPPFRIVDPVNRDVALILGCPSQLMS